MLQKVYYAQPSLSRRPVLVDSYWLSVEVKRPTPPEEGAVDHPRPACKPSAERNRVRYCSCSLRCSGGASTLHLVLFSQTGMFVVLTIRQFRCNFLVTGALGHPGERGYRAPEATEKVRRADPLRAEVPRDDKLKALVGTTRGRDLTQTSLEANFSAARQPLVRFS